MPSKVMFNPELTSKEKEVSGILSPADFIFRDVAEGYGKKPKLWMFYFKNMVAIEFTSVSTKFHSLTDVKDELCFTNSRIPPMNVRKLGYKLSEEAVDKVADEYLTQTAHNVLLEKDKAN